MDPHCMWRSAAVLPAPAQIVPPGFFLVWFGAAAIVTGVVAWLVPIGVPVQLGAFAVLAVIILYGARRWLKANPITSTDPHLNQRASRLVGEVLTVTGAIEDGRGRARVGAGERSEEHTSELPSLMRHSSAVFFFTKKKKNK